MGPALLAKMIVCRFTSPLNPLSIAWRRDLLRRAEREKIGQSKPCPNENPSVRNK
jgi:hypothetical protein